MELKQRARIELMNYLVSELESKTANNLLKKEIDNVILLGLELKKLSRCAKCENIKIPYEMGSDGKNWCSDCEEKH